MSFPAEWALHRGTWLAWPDLPKEWAENHEGARKEFLDLCRAIATTGAAPQETLNIFIKNESERSRIESELSGLRLRFYIFDYGDIWLRDTACVFAADHTAHVFRFNGWGGKYILAKDAELATEVAKKADAKLVRHSYILEGGAIDHNGNGLWVTTKQCLLNANRNKEMNQGDYEEKFKSLGARDICWISEGLLNDHTDGHVDNILRFVNEKTLLCMLPCGSADPHREKLLQIHEEAKVWADKHSLDLLTVDSPGEVQGPESFMPASYMNFYISNNCVVVPLYGTSSDEQAVEKIGKIFSSRKVIGLPSNNILTGGGSFHCITQQEPI
ncbi:MAG: agmatine deiminase family protein [Bdellovibrionota bacterium]